MIQRSTYTSRRNNPPQKFIPRRDLFPDAELPPPGTAAPSKAGSGSNRWYRDQTGSSYSNSNKSIEMTGSQQRNDKISREQTGGGHSKSQQAQPKSQTQTRIQPVSSSRDRQQKNQHLPLQQPLKPVRQQSVLPVSPAILLLLLAGGFLLWPKLKEYQPKLVSKAESAFKSIVDNPQSIQMLRTIGPYLEDREQDAVFTVAGVLEAVNTFRGVMNHTYHDRYRNAILSVPSSPAAKRLELMKAMKPYIPQGTRTQLDQVLGIYNTVEQLNRNIDIFRNNRTLAGDRKAGTLETIGDIFNVVRPALPREYREKGDKAVQALKLMEAAGAAEKMSRDSRKEKAAPNKNDRNAGQDKASAMAPGQTAEKGDHSADGTDQVKNLMDSFAPMLNDEQKDSLNMIVKMAQLLAQPGSDSQESDNEGQ